MRKVSEGVDIKRLRVMVMATKPGTQLLFRQLVGRVVRVEDRSKQEDATVYMASFPQLKEWARQIEAESNDGLRDKRESRELEGKERQQSDFSPVGSTHLHDGATSSFGEQFSAQEIMWAEEQKKGDPVLSEIPISVIAHLMRKQGNQPAPDYAGEPKHETKKRLRKSINNLVRRVAIQAAPDKPDFSGVWQYLHRAAGVKGIDDLMDNHDIAKMRQVEELIKSALARGLANVA